METNKYLVIVPSGGTKQFKTGAEFLWWARVILHENGDEFYYSLSDESDAVKYINGLDGFTILG